MQLLLIEAMIYAHATSAIFMAPIGGERIIMMRF